MLFAKMTMTVNMTIMAPLPGANRAEAEAQMTPEKKAEFVKQVGEQIIAEQLKGAGIEGSVTGVDLELVEV